VAVIVFALTSLAGLPAQGSRPRGPWLGTKESLGGGRSITPPDEIVVNRRQGHQLAVSKPMQAVMTESQLSIAPSTHELER